ncbi:MAG: hypothetical protein ACRD1V_11420 [Vicinamibacterales bacterium]
MKLVTKSPKLISKSPRHEVISVRLNEDRLTLLERYRDVLAERLGRAVTIAEAAFLVIEDRAVGMDRAATGRELLQAPTTSLVRIRKRWASQHTLSAAEWDVLAEYVQIGADEERQEPPLRLPAVPSRATYLGLLDAFEVVYQNRKEPASPHAWAYFGNLGGYATNVTLSDTDPDQREQAVRNQIARCRELLAPVDKWQAPGYIGRCLVMAVRDEGVESARLDQILAPHWSTLWGVAARGHGIRHDGQPVRAAGDAEDDVRSRFTLPDSLTSGDLRLSFASAGPELAAQIGFGGGRFSYLIYRYPELVEFRAMLEAPPDRSWHGRHFFTVMSKDNSQPGTRTLSLKRDACIDFSASEWIALRDLFRQAWESPHLERWIVELQQEYGEQG